MDSLLIESNRIIANAQLQQGLEDNHTKTTGDQIQLENNASWSTTIDSGIELKPGDTIQMEACALNINGAGSGNFQQFNGKVDTADNDGVFRKDNSMEIDIVFYTSNNIEFNFPLPSYRHMIELNDTMQGDYGEPSFSGRFLWRPQGRQFDSHYQAGGGIHSDAPAMLNTTVFDYGQGGLGSDPYFNDIPHHWIWNQCSYLNGPRTNQQQVGGYYFVDMNYSIPIPNAPLGTGPGQYTEDEQREYTKGLAELCAYVNWCGLVPWNNMPGIQFGTDLGDHMYPFPDVLGFDQGGTPPGTPEDIQQASCLNQNVDIKSRYTNQGYFASGHNGGAAPFMLLGIKNKSKPILVDGSEPGGAPQNWTEYDSGPPDLVKNYTYELNDEPAMYRGSASNYQPNSNKLYHPRKAKGEESYFCRGPYYNLSFNSLNHANPAYADTNMDDMQNMRVHSRRPTWWDFQKQKINIDLATGNIAPTRVSEVITDAMKIHNGNADNPETSFIKQKTYTPEAEGERNGFPGNLVENEEAGISGKSYATVSTLAGSCLKAAQEDPNAGNGPTGSVYGWDCITTDNIPLFSYTNDEPPTLLRPVGATSQGKYFNINQAKMQYWSNMLCGNPFEWKVCTTMLPLIQYRPCIDADIDGANFHSYEYWSVYTGETHITSGPQAFGDVFDYRQKADGINNSAIQIGEYGCNPCLLATPTNQSTGTYPKPTYSYRGLWNIQMGTSNNNGVNAGGGLHGPYRIISYPYGLWDAPCPYVYNDPPNPVVRGQTGHEAVAYNVFAPQSPTSIVNPGPAGEYEIILTNIIFDGQLTIDVINDLMGTIEGHNVVAGGNDTLGSQSNEFFNNTWVKWKMGRLNDQMTFPEQYTDEYMHNLQSYKGQKGVAQYLPNVFQSNKLYSNQPKDAGTNAVVRGDINDILSNSNKYPFVPPGLLSRQGTYTMCPMKMGIYEGKGAGQPPLPPPPYNDQYNPDIFPCGGAAGQPQYPNSTPSPLPTVQGGGFGQPADTNHGAQYQDEWRFGAPCWTFFKNEMIEDLPVNKTGFDKICDRSFKGFRYFPQGQSPSTEYNAHNAWNKTIFTGLGANYTTRPEQFVGGYAAFEALWDKISSFNNGRGIGVIPIFHTGTKSAKFNSVPFLGIIYQSHDYKHMPLPVQGEFIMLGTSPSLTQNDLHLPATTQQRNSEVFTAGWNGNQTVNPSTTPTSYNPTIKEVQTRTLKVGTPSVNGPSMYVGTNDPVWSFDNTYNRYSYSKFHTTYFKGNGVYQYGDAGAATSPEEAEVKLRGQTAAFSRAMTLPCSCLMKQTNADTSNPPKDLIYTENIAHNWICDIFSPGGAPSVPNTENVQYGSPYSATQWEIKHMPNVGTQTLHVPNIDGISAPPLCMFPPTDHPLDEDSVEGTRWTTPHNIMPYAYINSSIKPYPTISSQSGVSILDLYVPRTNSTSTKLTNTDYKAFKGTLFQKMGFVLNQFLPLFSQVQTILDHTLFSKYARADAPAGLAYHNCPYPISTQALISTSLTPSLQSGFGILGHDPPITSPIDEPFPFYRLGMLIASGRANAISESVYAANLPQKLNFPYLVCRSNIMTPTALSYIGGPNGQQLLPAIAYLMTNYATNDFFYIQKSELIFKVNRPYTLTELRTSIHLPNGELADKILDTNSAVIYRINFADPLDPKSQAEEKKYEDKILDIDPKGPEI